MRKCGSWPISVCSWSLRTGVDGVVATMRKMNVDHVHLALGPALEKDGAAYMDAVRRQSWKISATMIAFPGEDYSSLESIRKTGGIAPDASWPENRRLVTGAIEIAAELGVRYLSLHLGFIDHADPDYVQKFYDRTRLLADAAAARDVQLLLETGQETADELCHFMKMMNHPALAINFDPANMILYDKGDPLGAVRILAPWIRHVHAKDARRTRTPGTWGEEVPWGDGEVNVDAFLRRLKDIDYDGALAIEREMGDNREGDIGLAVDRLDAFPG
jgi:sugar phosphate isomerase/epimerase